MWKGKDVARERVLLDDSFVRHRQRQPRKMLLLARAAGLGIHAGKLCPVRFQPEIRPESNASRSGCDALMK